MTLILNLPPELETELADEAARLGLPLSEYALRLLAGVRKPKPAPCSGAELFDYWQKEELIGTRPEIADASEHARSLRKQSQRKAQPYLMDLVETEICRLREAKSSLESIRCDPECLRSSQPFAHPAFPRQPPGIDRIAFLPVRQK
jgi:hypothetical protein